jgi:DNA polymerase-1
MANYIITSNKEAFEKIGSYNYADLSILSRLPETIAVDTETDRFSPIDGDIFCVQIGTGLNNVLIDLQEYPNTTPITFQDIVPYIKDKTLVFQNAVFDIKFFYKYGFYPEKVRDTLIASKILHNGSPPSVRHGLDDIFERELNINIDKSEQKNIHKVRLSTARAIHYCFNDVDKLLELHTNLVMKLTNYGSLEAYLLNCEFLKALAYMENCGLPINENLWKTKMIEDEQESKRAAEEIKNYIFDNLLEFRKNQLELFSSDKKISVLLSSPVQMVDVFKAFGINTTNDEGKDSIKEDVINKTKHEFVDMWLKYQGAQHRVTTFGQNVLDKVIDGRLYCNFNALVETGRLSSRKGSINFLNLPSDKETRNCFEAKAGNIIIDADYANQESRILAYKSQDENSILNIVQNRDSHSLLAREAFPELKTLTDKEIKTNHSDKRQIGKVINFAVSFGASGYTIAKNLNVEPEEGERLYQVYKNLYKDVFTWGNQIFNAAVKKGYIESAEGFKLKLPFYSDYLYKEKKVKEINKELYSMGKAQYKEYLAIKEAREKDKTIPKYKPEDEKSFEYYYNNKETISSFMKLKSLYTRLCLNNPM